MDGTLPPQVPESHVMRKKLLFVFLAALLFVGYGVVFGAGYYMHDSLKSEQVTKDVKPEPTRPPTTPTAITPGEKSVDTDTPQDTTKFLPGKAYMENSIIMVAKSDPRITLLATITRLQNESNYTQNTRVSFFDGKSWVRKTDAKTNPDSRIYSTGLIQSWTDTLDPSRVLKQTITGDISINSHAIRFESNPFANEISVRSLPEYTKFMSNGTGRMAVDGVSYDMYAIYTQIYSLNAGYIQFYNNPFGVTTDWVAFWDTAGNFYHIDRTDLPKPTEFYKPHQFGVFENPSGVISKTFTVDVARDSVEKPTHYTVTIGDPANQVLTLDLLNSFNKFPGASYTWFMGHVKGTVMGSSGQSIPGFGLVEYIHEE